LTIASWNASSTLHVTYGQRRHHNSSSSPARQERLQSIAKARQAAVIDVLHAAIDALERQQFLRGVNQDYQRLRENPERWEQYLAERQEWDSLA
jgi:hypothetical protein